MSNLISSIVANLMPLQTPAEHLDEETNAKPLVWLISDKDSDVAQIAKTALGDTYKFLVSADATFLPQPNREHPILIVWDIVQQELNRQLFGEQLRRLVTVNAAPVLFILQPKHIPTLREWHLAGRTIDFTTGMPNAQELSMRAELLINRADSTTAGAADKASGPYQQTLNALAESEAKFRTITNAMPQMVWSTRADGYHDYYNQQWYEYTGAPKGSTDGDKWNDMFHHDDQKRAWNAWHHSLATGEPYYIEYRVRHHSGKYRWTLGRALPVRDEAGKIIRWMGTCTDIHDQKMNEEALQNASRQKDKFLAVLAHELRNPLAPLLNSTALLRRAMPLSDTRSTLALDVIERQVEHMTRLVGDLMDVARITTGRLQLKRVPCELNSVISQVIEDFEYFLGNSGLKHVATYSEQALWIEGDATRIAQIIGNLLHNAAKFTATGGDIRVRTQAITNEMGESAVVYIEDTGEGIEPALAKTLFNPFVQADQGLARVDGGLGLGLSLVKGFMELHEGSVAVSSEGKGRGAVFTLTFPRIGTPEHSDAVPLAGSGISSRKLKIVLIDDNQDMVDTMSILLQMSGHAVATAVDGSTGIGVIDSEAPDVVICDIGLPGEIDGYAVAQAVCEKAQADNKPLLLALSGYGDKEARQRAKESGFDVHLLKPLQLDELNKLLDARFSTKITLD